VSVNICKGDFHSLKKTLEDNGLSEAAIFELKQALDAEPETVASGFGPRVAGWIGAMMKKAADGSWKIGTGAAGSLLANVLGKYYGL
jgi:hypothetical protein